MFCGNHVTQKPTGCRGVARISEKGGSSAKVGNVRKYAQTRTKFTSSQTASVGY